jgi:hypothetical protein
MFVSYEDAGDAWVEAPDGGIGTLIWDQVEPSYFKESIAPDPSGRWGTYAVQLPLPLTTDEEAADYLGHFCQRSSGVGRLGRLSATDNAYWKWRYRAQQTLSAVRSVSCRLGMTGVR